MFEPEVFRKQMGCWRKYLRHCWDFLALPAVIQRPHSDSAPGNCAPLTPIVTPLLTTHHGVGVRWNVQTILKGNKHSNSVPASTAFRHTEKLHGQRKMNTSTQ